MKREIEIRERMIEIQKEIENRNDEINDEVVPGAYFYDVEKVENLKKEIEELQDEHDNLDAFPTREKIEQEKNALNEELEDVEEDLSEYRQGGIYFPTEEMIELEEKEKELKEKIAKKDENLNIIDEIEETENDLDDLEEEKKEYIGAYFIPDEILNEIDEKKQKLEELYKKLGEYTNDRKKNKEREDLENSGKRKDSGTRTGRDSRDGSGRAQGEDPESPRGRGDGSEGQGEGHGDGPDDDGSKEDPEDDGDKIIGGPDDHRVGPGGGRGDDPDPHPTIQTGLQIFRREFNEMPEILKKHTFSENPLLPLPGSIALALATAGIVTGPIGWAGAAGIAALSYVGAKPLLRKITGQSKLEKQITEQFNDMDPKELKEMADYLTEERIIDLKPNAVILRALNRSLRTIAQRENADLEREMNEAEQERDELLAKEEPLTESEKERLETLKKEIDDKVKEMDDNEKRAKEARRGKERISAAYKGNIRGSKILNIFHKRNSTTQEYKDALNEYADKEKEMLEADERGDAVSAAKAQKEMKETGEKNTYINGLGLLRSPFNMRSAPARVVSDREDHTVRNIGMLAMATAALARTLGVLDKAKDTIEQVFNQHNKDVNTVNNFANQFGNQQNSFTNASTSITDSNITRAARAHAKGIADAGEMNAIRLNGNASLDPSYVQSDTVINSRIDTMSQNIGNFPTNGSTSDKLRWLADYLRSGESTATLKESQNLAGNIHSGAGVDHLSQIDLQQTAVKDNKKAAKLYEKFADLYDQGQGFLKMNAPTLKTMTQDFKADLIGPFAQFFTTLSAPVIDIFKGRDKYKVEPEKDVEEEIEDDKKKDKSEER